MKRLYILFLLLFVVSKVSAQQTNLLAAIHSEKTFKKGVVTTKQGDVLSNPNLLLEIWSDEPIPIAVYSVQELKYQHYLNEKAENLIKTYSSIDDDAFYPTHNLKLPIDQRHIDNEPITPYTWKWLDLEKEDNGEKVVVKLRRPNWWILANKADKIGNIVYLDLPELGITGGFTVKGIRVSQIDTRLMKPKREGDYTYRPLTGWIQHETSNVWNYTFSNGETIGATSNHPFYSERRKDYIPIGEIEIGEAIRNPQNEVITLASKSQRTNGTEKVYNLEIYRDHNFLVGKSSLLVHNYYLSGNPLSKVKSFKRDGMSFAIDLFEDIERPLNDNGKGLIHILERHSPDFYPSHSKGDLFPSGTTIEQILKGIEEVFAKGTRQTDPNKAMQQFRKRIKINGESANYDLWVDVKNKIIVTFYKIGQ